MTMPDLCEAHQMKKVSLSDLELREKLRLMRIDQQKNFPALAKCESVPTDEWIELYREAEQKGMPLP